MPPREPSSLDEPWSRSLPARLAREGIVLGIFGSIVESYCRREIVGLENLEAVPGPAILVANHSSHIDTPLLLVCLPGRRRRRTVVAAAVDYFYTRRHLAMAVSLAFGTVPLERNGGGVTQEGASGHIEALLARGWSLVIFPEGTRSRDGRVGPLRSGAALFAADLGVPLIPVHIAGTHELMPPGRAWPERPHGRRWRRWLRHPGSEPPPTRHTVRVSFGEPIAVQRGGDLREAMEQVRLFMDSCGARTTPDPRLAEEPVAEPAPAAVASTES